MNISLSVLDRKTPFTVSLSVSEHIMHTVHVQLYLFIPSWSLSAASFIVFDAVNRHQRVPDDEAICPRLHCPGLHPLCPHYFV